MHYSIKFIAGKELVFFERMPFIPRVGDTILMPLDKPYKVTDVIYKPATISDDYSVVVIISPKQP